MTVPSVNAVIGIRNSYSYRQPASNLLVHFTAICLYQKKFEPRASRVLQRTMTKSLFWNLIPLFLPLPAPWMLSICLQFLIYFFFFFFFLSLWRQIFLFSFSCFPVLLQQHQKGTENNSEHISALHVSNSGGQEKALPVCSPGKVSPSVMAVALCMQCPQSQQKGTGAGHAWWWMAAPTSVPPPHGALKCNTQSNGPTPERKTKDYLPQYCFSKWPNSFKFPDIFQLPTNKSFSCRLLTLPKLLATGEKLLQKEDLAATSPAYKSRYRKHIKLLRITFQQHGCRTVCSRSNCEAITKQAVYTIARMNSITALILHHLIIYFIFAR